MERRNVFVIHGRNEAARVAIFQFLRSIGLQPLEWAHIVDATGKGSPIENADSAVTTRAVYEGSMPVETSSKCGCLAISREFSEAQKICKFVGNIARTYRRFDTLIISTTLLPVIGYNTAKGD